MYVKQLWPNVYTNFSCLPNRFHAVFVIIEQTFDFSFLIFRQDWFWCNPEDFGLRHRRSEWFPHPYSLASTLYIRNVYDIQDSTATTSEHDEVLGENSKWEYWLYEISINYDTANNVILPASFFAFQSRRLPGARPAGPHAAMLHQASISSGIIFQTIGNAGHLLLFPNVLRLRSKWMSLVSC